MKAAYPEGIADGCDPALEGHYTLADGTRVAPSFQLLRERVASCTPDWAEAITGIPAARIVKLAEELGETALRHAFELPIPWTDAWGKQHPTTQARPVAFHAMRGLAAHSNGFQTVRALAVLMSVLGTIDAPGGFRHKAPYPRHIVPNYRAFNDPGMIQPNTPLNAAPLGFPANPEELAINPDGSPIRIDHAFSWEHPLSAHGLMHNVIGNAVKGDPYRLDTLLIFMANMAWNSSMNTMVAREMLNRKDADGEYMIPFLVVCDAFQSETVAFADLVLPDTTYLERHDVMSMLDRPISEFDGPVDSVRVPVVPPTGECRPFQEVLIELASRLKFPAFTTADGARKFKDYPEFVVNFQPQPGIGFLMGWRGKDGTQHLRGEPNPKQWEMYAQNDCVFQYHMPETMHFMRNWNREYLDFAKEKGWRQKNDPVQLALYSDTLQSFRLAAQGKTKGRQPPDTLRKRIETYFDPLPFWYAPLEDAATDLAAFPLNAITQRPMAMYHSWDSQNAWLRQIHSHNYLQVNPLTAARGRHRRRRLVLDREPVGQGALHGALQRGGRAGHGVDLERDRQGRRRVAARARRRRVEEGLPAEPPDQRRPAVRRRYRRRDAHQQLRSDHRPGRLVRRARAHPARRGRRGRRVRAAGASRHAPIRRRARSAFGRRQRSSPNGAGGDQMIRWLKELLASQAVADGAGGAVAERHRCAPRPRRRRRRRRDRPRCRSVPKRRPSRGSSRSSSTSTSASAATPA